MVNVQIDALADAQQALDRLANDLSYSGETDEIRAVTLARASQLRQAMDEALTPMETVARKRLGPILLLYFTTPPSAFGPGSYLSDMLESLGGRNALSGGAWQELDLEHIAALNPWAIVVVRPGAAAHTPEDRAAILGPIVRLNLDCVRMDRVAVIGHDQALLPGASLLDVAGELRAALQTLAELESTDQ